MNNAIVTGANGFIGKAVVKSLLKSGVTVHAIVRNKEGLSDIACDSLKVYEADFSGYDALISVIPHGIDVFYHFAWEGASGPILKDYTQQIKNIQYTCDVLSFAVALECKKFILAGTINELELVKFYEAEKNTPRPASIYGISKLACDFMCKTIAADKGILYNTAIIGSCFGPGDKSKRIHNIFIYNMLNNTKPKLVSGESKHDWIFVDDVADMFVAIGKRSVNMKNYYMGHNYLRRFDEILLEVRDILNPKMDIVFGEIKDSFEIDYSLVDINSVYEDTDYTCNSDFKTCVLKTAEWVKNTF